MSNRTIDLTDRLYDYMLSVSLREPTILAQLREETANMKWSVMQIAPEQGQFMAFLVEMIGARRTIEVGTYTGYSALVVALAMPPEGRVVACDISEETSAVASRYWAEAGVADMIDLRLAPASETLAGLIEEGQAGSYDFAFIDADKENYDAYYEACLELLRPGGLIAIDNVLWSGMVADPEEDGPATQALRAINEKIRDDQRVSVSMVPIGDGLTLVRKRPH